MYSGARAVTTSDFRDAELGPIKGCPIVSQAVQKGHWISLLNFVEKYKWDKVQIIMRGLLRRGIILEPALMEVPYGATARFPIQRLTAERLLTRASGSPCKMMEDGVWFCKMRRVFLVM
jgi:hypothetical protein